MNFFFHSFRPLVEIAVFNPLTFVSYRTNPSLLQSIYIACILLRNFQLCKLSDDLFFQCHHHVLTRAGLAKSSTTVTNLDTN